MVRLVGGIEDELDELSEVDHDEVSEVVVADD